MPADDFSSLNWAKVDLSSCPRIVVPPPGPVSDEYHRRCTRHFKGLSSQVKLFPVAFESGNGCVLVDVDGNRYIDFSSGIYVTTLGHCHPKVSEAIARHARQLMNAHDFTTPRQDPVGRETGRGAAGRPERFPVLRLRHGGGRGRHAGAPRRHRPQRDAQLLLRLPRQDLRVGFAGPASAHRSTAACGCPAPTWSPVPTPIAPFGPSPTERSTPTATSPSTTNTSTRPRWATWPASCSNRSRAGAGSVMPPDDFFPKLRRFCDQHGILLMADEVLTGWGRTGKWLCIEHWGVAARRGHHRQGLRQRLSGDLRGGPRAVQGEFREDLRLQQLRRQSRWPAPRRWPRPKSSRRRTCWSTPSTWAKWPERAWSG